ncbi:unnamed protein product [Rotaria sp. Silwood1]|nr:unnamed protein product [Rotaria sp. Silwood1]
MTSAVDFTATIDDELTSNTLKRRRSSNIIQNDSDIEQTPLKRVRTSSLTNNSTSDNNNNNNNNNNIQSMFNCLNDIVQSHRTLVHEYVNLQMCDRPDLSLDEQRFIQAEEDLIEKVEKNLHDINNTSFTPFTSSSVSVSSSRCGKRQRYQSINSSNQSFDRIKHETHILKRIDELKSDGKWTNQRLAKCLEPKKRKTHWDYLLDEMRWLAEDFILEKRWKQEMAKKLSIAVLKYFHDKNQLKNQQQHNEYKRIRKQAQFICKEVMNFWKNINKIAEYKQTTRLEQLRKHQLDINLNLIVNQTEKYSNWLVKSLQTTINQNQINNNDDSDYYIHDDINNEDNEETIEHEEQYEKDEYDLNELKELQADQQESIENLLKHHYGIDVLNLSNEKENNLSQELHQQQEDDDNEDENLSDSDINEIFDEESISNEIDDNNLIENNQITTDKQMNDLATTVQALQPTGFTLNTTTVKTPVPFLLKHPLREYQHVGLDWLVTLYEKKLNCILADEMGLGKTIQTIALLAHLACEKGVWGPHLIVVPTSVMLNWELEFKKWCPAFKILTYYGSIKERQLKRQGWTRMNAFHICITSYNLILQDAKLFRRKKWKYLILDEAHNIKNFKSQRWQTLLNFHSQRRLLLTGTPLQNSLMELWSLMHFLMPNLFSSHEEFRQWFSNPLTEIIEQGQIQTNDLLIKRLHKILRPFILRRLKIDVEKQMPKKFEHIIICHLSKRQRQLYEDFIQCKTTYDIIQQGNYMSVINILMQLRKVCNHPDLFEPRPIISPFIFQQYLIEYQIPKLIFNINLKNPCILYNTQPNDIFLCYRIQLSLQATKSMIMNIINSTNNDDKRQHIQLTTSIIERYRNSSIWSQSNEITTRNLRNHSEIKQNLLINLNDHEFQSENIYEHKRYERSEKHEICKQRQQERLSRYELLCQINAERCQSRPVYGSDLLSQIELAMRPCHRFNRITFSGYALCQQVYESLTKTQDYMSTTDTLRQLIKTNREVLDEYRDILNRFMICTTRVLASPIELFQSNGIRLTNKINKSKPIIEVLSSIDFDILSPIRQTMFLQFPERRLIQYDCGKLQTLDLLLSDLKHNKHRCLIFTQMTKMLDILEVFLNYHGYTYLRLDGTTQVFERQILMERFNSDEKIFVFLLSTRAGGIGVNLTGADTVIFYDSDWNPTMDAQAQDRCHRIGQTKDVHIYRLICKSTIEENILKKANQKRMLGDLTIDGGSFDVNYFKKNNIRELFDPSTTIEDVIRERNEYQEQLDLNRPTTMTDNNLTTTQIEEALASVEDETDRQAANELTQEVKAELIEFNEDEIIHLNEDQLIEKQKQNMNQIEEKLKTFDEQLRPIERYALRCIETHRGDHHQISQTNSNIYLNTEQIRKDWQLSRLKALKEQEDKQFEQEDDEMMYTYTRDNERKVKYNYTYSCARYSLVANELARYEKNSTVVPAVNHSFFSSPITSLLVPFSISPSPLLSPPPLSPAIIKHSFNPIKTYSKTSNDSVQQRRRLQIIPSPPQSPLLFTNIQTKLVDRKIKQQIPSRKNENQHKINNGDCINFIECLNSDDDDDDELHSNSNNSTSNYSNIIYSSKSKTSISTLIRTSPILPRKKSLSVTNTKSGVQRKVRFDDSSPSLNSLNKQSAISEMNFNNPKFQSSEPILTTKKSTRNLLSRIDTIDQSSIDKSSNSRLSSTTRTSYRIRSQLQSQTIQQKIRTRKNLTEI